MSTNGLSATLSDVAKRAGVGKSTASAVLRGASGSLRISTATQERVRTAASALHYRPNAVARGLAQGRMETLGVLFRNIEPMVIRNSYAAAVLEGIIWEAADAGFNVTLFTQPTYGPRSSTPFVYDRRTDGILLIAPTINSEIVATLAAQQVPLVIISSRFEEHGVPSVDVDNELGTRLAVEHLLGLGHTRIAHLMGADNQPDAIVRKDTFLATMSAAGITTSAEYIASTEYKLEIAYEATRRLLELEIPPTAIFASNDGLALAAISAARDMGISVPERLSVVGFDDMPAASSATPLTTVRQPLVEIGRLAAHLLLARINGEEIAAKTHLLAPELMVRQTTGPAL